MAQFDERRNAQETKFAHDEEMRFRAVARRNKAFGAWAAGRLGRSDVDAYAKSVVLADFAEQGDADVLRKVKADFDTAGIPVAEPELRARMDELLAAATAEVAAGR